MGQFWTVANNSDSHRFEKAICALLFMAGFSPTVQPETDAPDITMVSPNGTFVLVECTTGIKDFSVKLGKLVDRRNSLSEALAASNHPGRVDAFLVCAKPREKIAFKQNELQGYSVSLIAKEEIEAALDRVFVPNNPDALLDELQSRLRPDVGVSAR